MIFYHYTCLEHLEKIVDSGYLKLCESNIYPPSYVVETENGVGVTDEYLEAKKAGQPIVDENAMKGPPVVWLYRKPLTGKGPDMLQSEGVMPVDGRLFPVTIDKSRVEISVNIPAEDAQRADKFFRKHKTPEWWLRILEKAAGSSKVRDWYVIERIIPSEEWLEIKDRYNNKDAIKQGNSANREFNYENISSNRK